MEKSGQRWSVYILGFTSLISDIKNTKLIKKRHGTAIKKSIFLRTIYSHKRRKINNKL